MGRYTHPWAGNPPRQVHPPGQIHPQTGTPPWQAHPLPRQVHPLADTPTPGAVHAGRYGQQAGGTHPTGMHSCFYQLYP